MQNIKYVCSQSKRIYFKCSFNDHNLATISTSVNLSDHRRHRIIVHKIIVIVFIRVSIAISKIFAFTIVLVLSTRHTAHLFRVLVCYNIPLRHTKRWRKSVRIRSVLEQKLVLFGSRLRQLIDNCLVEASRLRIQCVH